MRQHTETAPISPRQGQWISAFILLLGIGMLALTYLWLRPMTMHVITGQPHIWILGVGLIAGGYIFGGAAVLAGATFLFGLQRNWIEL